MRRYRDDWQSIHVRQLMTGFPSQLQANRKIHAIALLTAYLGSRLCLLTRLPVFLDEAIHIDWARQTLQGEVGAGVWDGKWLSIKLMALFVGLPLDKLLAARLASVLIGVGTLAACVLIGSELFSQKEGFVAGIWYVLLPYALFYNRMALADGFQTAFGAWTLLLSIVVVRSPRRVYRVVLILLLTASILSKLTGFLFILFPPLAAIVLTPRAQWRSAWLRIAPSLLCALLLLCLLLWKGVGIGQFGSKAGDGDLAAPWTLVQNNLELASSWFWMLLTPLIAVLSGLSLIWLSLGSRSPEHWFLALVLSVSAVPYILGARVWFPRYLLFAVVPICLLIARFLCLVETRISTHVLDARRQGASVARSVVLAGSLLGLTVWPTLLNSSIVAHPEYARLPDVMRRQFVTHWPSGYGLVQLADYLNDRASSEPKGINLLRFGYLNQPNQGLDLYLRPSGILAIHTLDPSVPDLLPKLDDMVATRRTFLVLNPPVEADRLRLSNKNLSAFLKGASRVWYCPRPGGESGLEVWELGATQKIGDLDATRM